MTEQGIDNNLYVRVFRAGNVVIEPSWWDFRYPSNLFWRLYYNEQAGAPLNMPNQATFFCSWARSSRNAPLSRGSRIVRVKCRTASS